MNIVIAGGMGTGKTDLAKKIVEINPNYNYIYAGKYNASIPMTLIIRQRSEILKLPKKQFIEKIIQNQNIELGNFTRKTMNAYGRRAAKTYGNTIFGEVTYEACKGENNIIDNVAKYASVKYLKEKGFLVIYLHCHPETALARRTQNLKKIDEKKGLEEAIKKTAEFFEAHKCKELADTIYFTEKLTAEEIAHYLLNKQPQ